MKVFTIESFRILKVLGSQVSATGLGLIRAGTGSAYHVAGRRSDLVILCLCVV